MNPVASLKALVAAFWKVWSFMRWAKGQGARPDQLTDPERRAFLKFAVTAVPTLALLSGVRFEDFARQLPGPVTKHLEWLEDAPAPGPRIFAGKGDPDGMLSAPRGSLWIDTDSGTMLVNMTGETTWQKVTGDGSTIETIRPATEAWLGKPARPNTIIEPVILDGGGADPARPGSYFGFGRGRS